jgi:hypothetical protein
MACGLGSSQRLAGCCAAGEHEKEVVGLSHTCVQHNACGECCPKKGALAGFFAPAVSGSLLLCDLASGFWWYLALQLGNSLEGVTVPFSAINVLGPFHNTHSLPPT